MRFILIYFGSVDRPFLERLKDRPDVEVYRLYGTDLEHQIERAATAPRSTQSNLSRQDVEHPVDLAFVQSVAILIHEKVRLRSRAKASVPPFGVIGQDLAGRGMQRYQTGLPKLGSPNGEDASGPVQILGMEIHGFTEPEACDSQQSKEAVVGPGPQRVTGRPSFRSLQQLLDFLIDASIAAADSIVALVVL